MPILTVQITSEDDYKEFMRCRKNIRDHVGCIVVCQEEGTHFRKEMFADRYNVDWIYETCTANLGFEGLCRAIWGRVGRSWVKKV